MTGRLKKLWCSLLALVVTVSFFSINPLLFAENEEVKSLIDATNNGTLNVSVKDEDNNDLINSPSAVLQYSDKIIATLSWSFPNSFSLNTNTILTYDLPVEVNFETKSGPIKNGSQTVGVYEITGNQIKIQYTSEDFCNEEERQGQLSFQGTIDAAPDGTTSDEVITIVFPGVVSFNIHMIPPTENATVSVSKEFRDVDTVNHIYDCIITIVSAGNNTNVAVDDTMYPGMTLYGNSIALYSDSSLSNSYTNFRGFSETNGADTIHGTIPSMSDGEKIYLTYQVTVDPALFDWTTGNEFTSNYGDYYPNGYSGTIPNLVCVNSTEDPTGAQAWADIIALRYHFVKWSNERENDARGNLSWQIYVNDIINPEYTSGYILDTLPPLTSFNLDSVEVFQMINDVKTELPDDYVSIIETAKPNGDTEIKIVFSDAMMEALRSRGIYIQYTTHVDEQADDTAPYYNCAEIFYNGYSVQRTASSMNYTKPDELTKKYVYNASTAPAALYTIEVNPAALNLDPDHDYVILRDQMSTAFDLDISSLRVNGVAPNSEYLNYDPVTHSFTLKLNDSTAYVVSYSVNVNLVPGSTLDASNGTNSCELVGLQVKSSNPNTVINSIVYEDAASSSSQIGRATLNVIKHDSSSTTDTLSDATFTLAECTADTNGVISSATVSNTSTTGRDGSISFSELTRGVIYRLQETVAPDGYVLDSEARFIVFAQSSTDTYPSNVVYNGTTYSLLVVTSERASYDFYVSNDPVPTVTPTATNTPVPTNTVAPTATNTPVPTNTVAPTATSTPAPTNTVAPTATSTPVPTNTVAPTATNTPVPTNTVAPTATNTPVPTNTVAPTATSTPVPTNTVAPTATSTPVPTNTVAPTATSTPAPTNTVAPTATNTPVPTNTVAPTATSTPVPTNTVAPTVTPTPSGSSAEETPAATPTVVYGATATPTPTTTAVPTDSSTPSSTPSPTATSTSSVVSTGEADNILNVFATVLILSSMIAIGITRIRRRQNNR